MKRNSIPCPLCTANTPCPARSVTRRDVLSRSDFPLMFLRYHKEILAECLAFPKFPLHYLASIKPAVSPNTGAICAANETPGEGRGGSEFGSRVSHRSGPILMLNNFTCKRTFSIFGKQSVGLFLEVWGCVSEPPGSAPGPYAPET